jgi:hypothetical protein
MTAQLQAVVVKADLSDLADRLRDVNIEQVVFPPPGRPMSIVEIADWPETRTEMIARCANRVIELGAYGRVRQRGALSSFCLPDRDVYDPIWTTRESGSPRSHYYHQLQRDERRALERHARREGCSLIIDPSMHPKLKLDAVAIRSRLTTLLEFLESMPSDTVEVVISPRARGENLLIVGDWFSAESMVPRPKEGYRQTVFTWHAPTVLGQARRFDREFEDLGRGNTSVAAAVEEIEKIVDALPLCQSGDGEPVGT